MRTFTNCRYYNTSVLYVVCNLCLCNPGGGLRSRACVRRARARVHARGRHAVVPRARGPARQPTVSI